MIVADKFERFARETTMVKPDSGFTLWCPFCDDWRLTDSMVARKKLGLHVCSYHSEEVRFKRGVKPPSLEEVDSLVGGSSYSDFGWDHQSGNAVHQTATQEKEK